MPEASILLHFSFLSSALLASAVRYARLLCGGWRAPDYDLDLGAIGLDPVAHVLYWSVGESRQFPLSSAFEICFRSPPPLRPELGWFSFSTLMVSSPWCLGGVSLLLSGHDRYRRFPLRCGVQRAGGLVCLFLLSGLCTCWLRLCLAEVASMAYQSLT